ncbi:uncharacterized protein [Fopius arisanus]|uniref:Uncharacterized protein n=1 Tax=Fopius arisanus TaxID=64838 RepID=A0A9R1TH17_9HYME|nr:PREDICTED: uncharacterized protein LOC105269953 [Fopius arisanus]
MYLLLVFAFLALANSSPVKYDQRQDGKLNVHAKLENLLLIVAPSGSHPGSIDFDLPGILEHELDFRSAAQENGKTSQPGDHFQEIGEHHQFQKDELKLIGDAIENCGPGRYRDSVGICRSEESGALKN